jgi:hypothetical protein
VTPQRGAGHCLFFRSNPRVKFILSVLISTII